MRVVREDSVDHVDGLPYADTELTVLQRVLRWFPKASPGNQEPLGVIETKYAPAQDRYRGQD